MSLRGESIGAAYVRILADGSGFDRSVREQMDDVDWDKHGRKASKEWSDGFAEEQEKKPNQKKLRDAIAAPLTRGSWLTEDFFRSKNWTDFRSSLAKEYGDAGRRAGQNFERDLLAGMDFDALDKRLTNITPDLLKARREMLDEAYQLNAEFNRRNQRLDAEADAEETQRQKKQRDMLNEAYRMHAEFGRKERAEVLKSKEQWAELNEQISLLAKGELKNHEHRGAYIRRLEEQSKVMRRLGLDTENWNRQLEGNRRLLARSSPHVDRWNHNIERLADTTSRGFGKGSRNNFVNFMGSMVGNLLRMGKIIPSVIGGVSRLAGTFSTAFNAAKAGGSGTFGALLSGGGAAFKSASKNIYVLVGALAVLALVIGPLVAAMSLLLGVVTALASTIVMSLVAAVGAAAAVMLPLVAGIGVTVAAFQSLSEAQKKSLSNKFAPVVKEFKALGDEARKGVFRQVKVQAEELAPALRGLRPLFRDVGEAIGNVGTDFAKSLNGPSFIKFRNAMTTFLPGAIESLGKSFRHLLGGFGGVIRGMIPFMEDVLDWLERITTKFDKWANSKQGQRQILDFFEDAKDAASALGDFLGAVWEFLWLIIRNGSGAGNSIFTSMADGVRNATQYLRDNPDALQRWFDDAVEFAAVLGEILQSVIAIVDALDTPVTRALATAGTSLLAGQVNMASKLIEWTNPISIVGKGLDLLSDKDEKAEAAAKAHADALRDYVAPVLLNFKSTLDQVTGAATKTTRSMLALQIQESGIGDEAARLGVSRRDLISAYEGNKKAIDKVVQATKNLTTAQQNVDAQRLLASLNLVGNEIDAEGMSIRQNATDTKTWKEALEGLPKKLGLKVENIGMDATLFELMELNRQFDITPTRFKTIFKAIGLDVGKKQLTEIVNAMVTLDGMKAIPNADLDDSKLTKKQKEAMRLLNSLGLQKPTPVTDLNDDRFEKKRKAALRRLGELTIHSWFSVLDANMQPLKEKTDTAGGWLAELTGRIHMVTVNFDGDLLTKLNQARGDLQRLNLADVRTAAGGMFNGAQWRIIGEAGAEAVVPLNRPLSQVDPAVRWLSAIAQGKAGSAMASGGVVGAGKTVNVEQHIYSPQADPRAVADEAVNRLVATGY